MKQVPKNTSEKQVEIEVFRMIKQLISRRESTIGFSSSSAISCSILGVVYFCVDSDAANLTKTPFSLQATTTEFIEEF